jgi:hypothetical protein
MNDTGKIIAGLVVFLVLVTFPFWFGMTAGDSSYVPEPELPAGEESCVESREYMRSFHMDLLNQWRDAVVRDGERVYVSALDGKKFEMSISATCIKCHVSKVNFCDQCHDYVGVDPYCWDCHVEPAEPVTAGGR